MVKDDDGTVVVSLYDELERDETKQGRKDNQSIDSEKGSGSSK
jgi:hypothetical protein